MENTQDIFNDLKIQAGLFSIGFGAGFGVLLTEIKVFMGNITMSAIFNGFPKSRFVR